jgi:PqqD family protein of HPr-rel-A system
MVAAIGQVWQLVQRPALLWCAWEGEIVVYNDASGDTHRLDPLAAEAFEALLEGPADLPALAERVARSLGVEGALEMGSALAVVLGRFHRLGLTEPAPKR